MSDQNVVTDWAAHFASLRSLGRSAPLRLEPEANPRMILIMDTAVGSLMSRMELSDEACLTEALEAWTAAGQPRAWLQRGNGTAPWFVNAVVSSLPPGGRVRSGR